MVNALPRNLRTARVVEGTRGVDVPEIPEDVLARRVTLHLPTAWPWHSAWTRLFTHSCGPPKPAKLPLLVEPATVDPHDSADLDWPDAAVPDDRLLAVWNTPVVALNRAAAVAFAEGPAAAMPLLDELTTDPRLADYPYLHATRADLLRRLGDAAGAAQSYRRAMELTANAAERAFLEQRLAEVSRAAGAEPAPG